MHSATNPIQPGRFYLQGSVLFFARHGDPIVLDTDVEGVQEAADIVADIAPEHWLYTFIPNKRPKRKARK